MSDLSLFIKTFKSVLRGLPVPCFILDLVGTIVFSNDATIQLTGYQREIDFKRSFLSQLDDEYIDKTIEHLDNKNQKSVCRALVAMGRNLGMNMVAEGARKWSNINTYAALAAIKSKVTILADPLQLI